MSLGTFSRASSLHALRNHTFDVVIIGGGITGAGAALDAASRGLRTALIEKDDFASGTSSKSSKMIHGGIRYIQHGDIKLVYEALAERQRLLSNAAHLVRELPFLIPILSKDGLFPRKAATGLGSALWIYDMTGGARIGKLHKKLSPDEVLDSFPGLHRKNVAGGYLYYDAAADDARLTLTLARTAALDHGATVVNGVRVTALNDLQYGHRTVTVEADGETFDVTTRCIVNATGVWADQVRNLDDPAAAPSIRPAKGTHIVIPRSLVQLDVATVLPVKGDKRSVFLVPWGEQIYIGTTDTDYDGPIDNPTITREDIKYLLHGVNNMSQLKLTIDDITGTWAGLRPLVSTASTDTKVAKTADLSRRHRVDVSANGLITVTGGKLTTYRDMAADTIDQAVDQLGDDNLPFSRRCRTRKLKLRGSTQLVDALKLLREHPLLDEADAVHLLGRFGSECGIIAAMIDNDPTLAGRLDPELPYLRVEVQYVARHEMVRTLDDILSRRLRARIRNWKATARIAPVVAKLVADDLGWDDATQASQVDDFIQSLHSEATGAALPGAVLPT
ncbi:MAG: glycerol-3-phosphate dehydrogenase/oxidase [Acidimicrobiales bacterium]|jgi:glycerol-3-phosphate dehydrogenase